MTTAYPSRRVERDEHRATRTRALRRRDAQQEHRPKNLPQRLRAVPDPAVVDVDSLDDDAYGSLVLRNADTGQRDPQVWAQIIAPERMPRSYAVLEHMEQVNQIARSTRREELLQTKADLDMLVASGQAHHNEYTRVKGEFDVWDERAKRFHLRVRAAMTELRLARLADVRADASFGAWKLLETVSRYLGGAIDADELEQVAGDLERRMRNVAADIGQTQVWAVCEVQADGTSIAPVYEDWHERRDAAVADVNAEPGAVLGTARVSTWVRD